MATRDRSVGIGFSNTNVYVLYKKAQAAAAVARAQGAADPAQHGTRHENQAVEQNGPRIFRTDELAQARIQTFKPRSVVIKADEAATANASAPIQADESEIKSLHDLKSNLSRLHEMHSKLRFMLNELEDLVAKKK